jgi:cysteine synthase
MNEVRRNILDCIGNTSLMALRNVVPANGSRILLKLESENPTGSMKDRMALAMIEAAEANGRLKAGGSVVEYTGGSTGVSLSLICAVKGYPLHIVTSDAFAREKLDHMKNLGARLTIVRSDSGRMTEKLTRDMIEAAKGGARLTAFYIGCQSRRAFDQIGVPQYAKDRRHHQISGRELAIEILSFAQLFGKFFQPQLDALFEDWTMLLRPVLAGKEEIELGKLLDHDFHRVERTEQPSDGACPGGFIGG